MSLLQGAQHHFSRVATVYARFRNTDPDVVEAIVSEFHGHHDPIDLADIGCGTGRYSAVLAARLNGQVRMICCDYTPAMLDQCRARMNRCLRVNTISFCLSKADDLPIESGSLDGIVTFNAIHHFNLQGFLAEAGRVLRPDGVLAIYTRTPEQNARTIWGRYFPHFTERETRLIPRERLTRAIDGIPVLRLTSVREFSHRRLEPPELLLERARNCHYSTFSLYQPEEFQQALASFAKRLSELGNGTVEHSSENTLFVARRAVSAECHTDIAP